MALGIDRAIHLVTDGEEWDPQATASAIVEAIAGRTRSRRRARPDLLRERVGGLGRLSGGHPRGPRTRETVRDRPQGRHRRGRTSPLRARGTRRSRHLRSSAACGGHGEGRARTSPGIRRFQAACGRSGSRWPRALQPHARRASPRFGWSRRPERRGKPRSSGAGPKPRRAWSRCCSASGSCDDGARRGRAAAGWRRRALATGSRLRARPRRGSRCPRAGRNSRW